MLFNVYTLENIEPTKGLGAKIWDSNDQEYLDFYGGHAVISVGHSHPFYIEKIKDQLSKLGFYSNSVINSLQKELAEKLGKQSDYTDYQLFLCNSGAEANENAIKLASFHTGRKKIVALKDSFHGRTSAAVAATDIPKIVAPVNQNHEVLFLEKNDIKTLETALNTQEYAALLVEGIQGVGGIICFENEYLQQIADICKQTGTMLILDEVQSGYGRSGKFFAHQYAEIKPDIISMAKGMGNGFPIGGILISPDIKPGKGMLGTTFGGNHLACAAAIAVLDIIEKEDLIQNSKIIGDYLLSKLKESPQIKEVRGKGLMIGLEFDFEIAQLRKKLLHKHKIFTGVSGRNTIRLLPPLNINKHEADTVIAALKEELEHK
jgi:acetylornithine aminotransferase